MKNEHITQAHLVRESEAEDALRRQLTRGRYRNRQAAEQAMDTQRIRVLEAQERYNRIRAAVRSGQTVDMGSFDAPVLERKGWRRYR
jgi:hypothetical protein